MKGETMSTLKILAMALEAAEAGAKPDDDVRVTISRIINPDSGARAIRIAVAPTFNTGTKGLGELVISGRGADIDAAALDMLPSLQRAATDTAERLEDRRKSDAKRVGILNDVLIASYDTGGAA